MKHVYRMKLNAIIEAAEDLRFMHSEDTHAFWLHIDGDKLSKCEDLLNSIIDAIDGETETN